MAQIFFNGALISTVPVVVVGKGSQIRFTPAYNVGTQPRAFVIKSTMQSEVKISKQLLWPGLRKSFPQLLD